MSIYQVPTRRNKRDLQVEFCELCGMPIGHRHLMIAEVQGLRGFAVCDAHGFEARARSLPSNTDLLRVNPGIVINTPLREDPIGGIDSFYGNDG